MGDSGIMKQHAGTLPIFDRLIDEDIEHSSEPMIKRYVSENELKESLQRDLTLLLNTRVSPFWKESAEKSSMPFSYGANVTAPRFAETVFEIQALEQEVIKALNQFEPRLQNIQVKTVEAAGVAGKALIYIDAYLCIENRRTPMSFPIAVDV